MHSRGYVLNPPSRRDSHPISWSMAPKLFYLLTSRGTHVNTKNWYREEIDMWDEFGRRTPLGRGFSSKHSVEASAVGGISSFGRSAVSRMKAEAFGSAWWRGLDTKKEVSWWWIRDEHDAMLLILGNKYCNGGWLGVMLEPGYKNKPLVFVIWIEQFHHKPAPCQLSSPSSRAVEFFERSHRSVDLRKYRQPCITSSIMRWIWIAMQVVLLPCLVSCGGFKLGPRRFPCWFMSHALG
jgi:hypothetical protein